MKTVYLAGSINGCTYDEATEWREELSSYLTLAGFRTLDPMRGKSLLNDEDDTPIDDGNTPYKPEHIWKRDCRDIKESDIILANLSNLGSKPYIGTLMELGIASQTWKRVYLYNVPYDLRSHPFFTFPNFRIIDVEPQYIEEEKRWETFNEALTLEVMHHEDDVRG